MAATTTALARNNPDETIASMRAEEKLRCQVLQGVLCAYENGMETAREIDEQLAALVVHTESRLASEASLGGGSQLASGIAYAAAQRALRDWLQYRDLERLRGFLTMYGAAVRSGQPEIIGRFATA